MGSDCDHEDSLATWLWSSIDDQIYSSLICIQGHALGEPVRTRFLLSGTGHRWPWFPLWSPGRGQRRLLASHIRPGGVVFPRFVNLWGLHLFMCLYHATTLYQAGPAVNRLVFVSQDAGASRDFVSFSLPASSFSYGTDGTCAQIRQLPGIVELIFVTSLKVYISFSTMAEEFTACVCSLVGADMERMFVLVFGDRLPVQKKELLLPT